MGTTTAKNQDLVPQLWDTINAFLRWLDAHGYASYDPYDIWGTQYSLWARRLYYKKGIAGLPLIAPVLLLEIIFPGLRALFVKKERFATADGQLALAFLNLYEITHNDEYLEKAIILCEDLIRSSVPGYSGYCWGYPFDWQNFRGLWRKNTPYITSVPYCFEAFLKLYEISQVTRYQEAAASVAKFVFEDLRDTCVSAESSAASYSPIDTSQVVNASAYRAFVLFEAAYRLGYHDYERKAWRNVNFILQTQLSDGSWRYAVDHAGEAFIDHFHTCFVLKNLWKINRYLRSDTIDQSIRRGYTYYRRSLFDANDNPKSFAIEPRTQIVQLDLYNLAEAIQLGALVKEDISEAFALACKLACRLTEKYQLSDGHFVTRVYIGGRKHKFPYIRWAQAQIFYSLTSLLMMETQHRAEDNPKSATDRAAYDSRFIKSF